MATEITSLSVRVGSDLREYERGMARLSASLAKVERDIGQFSARVGKRLAVALTAPLTALGALSLRTASSFEGAMNRVQAVSGATGKQFAALSAQAKELGETTQYTAAQAADAMGFLAMAGFKTDQILGAMPSTLQLAAAAQIDLGRAADITSNILTGYGLAVEDLGRANDVLVKAFTRTNTDLEMLGQAFKYAGPVAKGAGVSFEEAAAALGLMGNAGIQASMAGTAMRGAIVRLLKPTAEVTRTLARLGISATTSEGNLRSLVDIVADLERVGATTGDMMALFGQRAGPAMAALVDQGAGALRDLTAELHTAGGTAERVAETQMKGLRGALLELKSAVEGLQIALAESGVIQGLADLARGAADAVRSVSRASPAFLQWAVAIGAAVAAIGPMLLIIGKLIIAVKALTVAIGTGLTIATGGAVVAVGALVAILTKVALAAAKAREESRKAREEYEQWQQSLATKSVADLTADRDEARAKRDEARRNQERLEGELERATGAATRRSIERKIEEYRREAAHYQNILIQVQNALGRARSADAGTGSTEAAAKAMADLGISLALTTENFHKLREAEEKAVAALGNLRIEQALAPAGEALDRVNEAFEETEERLRAIRRELARYPSDISGIPVPMSGVGTSIQQGLRNSLLGSTVIDPTRGRMVGVGAATMQAHELGALGNADRIVAAFQQAGVEFKDIPKDIRDNLERVYKNQRRVEQSYAGLRGGGKGMGAGDIGAALSGIGGMVGGRAGGAASGVGSAVMAVVSATSPLTAALGAAGGAMAALTSIFDGGASKIERVRESFSRLINFLSSKFSLLDTPAAQQFEELQAALADKLKKGPLRDLLLGSSMGNTQEFISATVQALEAVRELPKMWREVVMRDLFGGLSEEQVMEFLESLKRLTDATNDAVSSMLGVPRGFKVALARFNATAAQMQISSITGPTDTGGWVPGGTTTNSVTIEKVEIKAAEGVDVTQLWRDLQREIQRQAARGGATLGLAT